jgi:hypothetical protein
MTSHLDFHHLGLAVHSKRDAVTFLTALGYEEGAPVFDPIQKVNLMMCTHPSQPAVEIIWPGPEKSPIDALIQRLAAGVVYHICYSTHDLAAALEAMEEAGMRIIRSSPPNPAVLFDGQKVSFYQVTGMGLIEILELD